MKRIFVLSTALLLCIAASHAAPHPHHIAGSGKMLTDLRQVESYTALKVSRGIEATIVEGNPGELHIEADEMIFPYLSKKLGMPEARIYSVATFYENFSLNPKGKFVIKVCDGTACHVRGSIPILERVRAELGLTDKKVTTDDLGFTVETVSCLGACGLAPVLTVNDEVHPAMTPDKAAELVAALRKEL